MNAKTKVITLISAALLVGLIGCQKEKYTLGPFPSPSDIQVTATVAGQSAAMPNGDGSGVVQLNVAAKDAALYKVDFGDGSAPVMTQTFPISKTFNKVIGTKTYGVTVTAYAVAGASPSVSVVDSVKVFYAYHVPASVLTMLTNNSVTGKRWMVDSTASGNMGLGPETSYYPDWYSAAPGDKTGTGLYTNVYTFTNDGMFVDSTYNKIFGSIDYFNQDFQNPAPGVFGGYGKDWILYWPTYSVKYTFSGDDAGGASSTGAAIDFEKPGSVGYYTGTQHFQILSLTDSTMWLRTDQPGVSTAYYVKLKAKK